MDRALALSPALAPADAGAGLRLRGLLLLSLL
jgi:hypothetical protein